MGLKQKLAIMAGIPILGLIALAAIGWIYLSQQTQMISVLIDEHFLPLVEQDVVELNKLQASVKTLLEADRDAYQALLAERNIVRAHPGADVGKQAEAHQENMQQVVDRVTKASSAFDQAMMDKFATFQSQYKQWALLSRQVVSLAASAETRDQAEAMSNGKALKAFGDMRDTIDGITGLLDKKITATLAKVSTKKDAAAKLGAQDREGAQRATWLFMVIAVVVAIASVVLMVLLTISIARPIRIVASGLSQGADHLATASSEVSSASQSVAQGTSEQAAGLEETSSSMEQMASMTKQNADNAQQADNMMKEAAAIVAEAVQAMGNMRAAMEEINSASNETAKIVKSIDEIAFQTNLLALNAAVEAARAGEAGAGFAVVADEVRALAMRAAEAAKNTTALIEKNIRDIDAGFELVVSTDETFTRVRDSARKVGELVTEISAASVEQTQGIQQMNLALGHMDGVTQANAASAEEAASASEELNAQTESLRGYVVELRKVLGQKVVASVQARMPNGREHQPKSSGNEYLALPKGEDRAEDDDLGDF